MIVERTSKQTKFSHLLPGEVFGIGDGVHMAIINCGVIYAVNLLTGKAIDLRADVVVTRYVDAKLIV